MSPTGYVEWAAYADMQRRAWKAESLLTQRQALRRELEELLGMTDAAPASEERFIAGMQNLRAIIAERDAWRQNAEDLESDLHCIRTVCTAERMLLTIGDKSLSDHAALKSQAEPCGYCGKRTCADAPCPKRVRDADAHVASGTVLYPKRKGAA